MLRAERGRKSQDSTILGRAGARTRRRSRRRFGPPCPTGSARTVAALLTPTGLSPYSAAKAFR